MPDYKLLRRKPTAEELVSLYKLVGWSVPNKEALRRGLRNSLFAVCVFNSEGIIGTARVVGDGSTCFYIQDVIIRPQYQGLGIGTIIMEAVLKYIDKTACIGAIVGLMSAKDKEGFYEKFGFWKRPNESFGCGMMQIWKEKYTLYEL